MILTASRDKVQGLFGCILPAVYDFEIIDHHRVELGEG
jgi:hypothetical protein